MSTDGETVFEQIGRWQLPGGGDVLPPEAPIVEITVERPRSWEVLIECPAEDCCASGRAEQYDNRNTYWRCSECGEPAMVPVR